MDGNAFSAKNYNRKKEPSFGIYQNWSYKLLD